MDHKLKLSHTCASFCIRPVSEQTWFSVRSWNSWHLLPLSPSHWTCSIDNSTSRGILVIFVLRKVSTIWGNNDCHFPLACPHPSCEHREIENLSFPSKWISLWIVILNVRDDSFSMFSRRSLCHDVSWRRTPLTILVIVCLQNTHFIAIATFLKVSFCPVDNTTFTFLKVQGYQ